MTTHAVASPNLLVAIPVLHVSSAQPAEEFYGQKLGFTREWEYRSASPAPDPAFLGFRRDGVALHLSSFAGDGVAGGVVVFHVRDVEALFAEFAARGVEIELPPCDQTWGNREMYVRDVDGNSLRFVQPRR